MISASGCFGSPKPENETIDNIEEVSSAVDDILDGMDTDDGTATAADAAFQLAQAFAGMERRVRLLTWAVAVLAAVLAAVLIAKELKN